MNRTHIVIHHSQTADNSTLSNVGAIRKHHVEVNGWRAIGYNWLLDRMAGRVEVVMGRLPDEDGAHAEPHFNRVGIGICCVGNFDIEAPPEDLLAELRRLVVYLMRANTIPVENVIGHREAQAIDGKPLAERKSCPGKMWDMDAFRASIKGAA